MKRCTRCGLTKNFTDFYSDRNRPDGLACQCRACKKAICLKGQADRRKYVAVAKEYEKALIEVRQELIDMEAGFRYYQDAKKYDHILLVIERALK